MMETQTFRFDSREKYETMLQDLILCSRSSGDELGQEYEDLVAEYVLFCCEGDAD